MNERDRADAVKALEAVIQDDSKPSAVRNWARYLLIQAKTSSGDSRTVARFIHDQVPTLLTDGLRRHIMDDLIEETVSFAVSPKNEANKCDWCVDTRTCNMVCHNRMSVCNVCREACLRHCWEGIRKYLHLRQFVLDQVGKYIE